ncbi:unnamed protein product [Paramecium octaurelia]|uniref:Uncharacterized protein n=1 Tax=Paramecium octaurelia TaxID=43137 RepID=A0A8S1VZK1_PAROT|nr:unnamed protein product [Paramecium octaurelia]
MKLKEKFYDKPDATTVSLLQSIKMNPYFQKLISFSLNCLFSQMYLPNNKHRDNSIYIFKEGYSILIQCIDNHRQSDQVIQNVCGCLNRMIGLHKFRDEFIARNVIDSNLSHVISSITNRQLSQEAIKSTLDLYQNLTFTQLQTDSLAKSNILVGFVQILIVSKPLILEMKRIFDLEYKMLIQECTIENINIHELITIYIQLMQEYIDNIFVIKETLRILLLLVNNQNALKVIKQKQSIPLKIMSEILIQHNDIDVNDKGAQILQSIINIEQVQQSIQSIKSLDQQAEFSMSLVACLIPAIHNQINLDELINILFDLVKGYKKIVKRKPILRDALNCLSRLYDQDQDYAIKLKQFLALMMELYENEDAEVVAASFDLSRKLGTNLTIEELNKIIEKVIAQLAQLKGVKDGLRLLLTYASKNDKTFKAIAKGKEAFFKIIENVNNQTSQEYNSKLLLLIHQEIKDYIIKKLSVIVQFIQKHYLWKRSLLYYIQILNKYPEQVAQLKSNLMISILSCKKNKDYISIVSTLKQVKTDSEPEEDDPEEVAIEFQQNEELEQQFIILVRNLTKQDDVKALQKEIIGNKYNDELSQVMLEIQLLKLSYYVQIEGTFYLQNDYFAELMNYLLKFLKSYKAEMIDIVQCIFLLLQTMSTLYWNDKTGTLYTQKKTSQLCFDFLFQSLENEELMDSSLDTILFMGQGCKNTNRKQHYLLDIQDNQYVIQLISQLQILMKKYVQKERIQLKILDVIKIYLLFELFKQNVRDLPKILCRKLPEDTTTKEMGLETIQILSDINYTDNALKYVTLFQLQHQYDIEVINQVIPYIDTVQKYEGDSFLTEEIKKQIKQMIQYFEEMEDPEVGAEYMDKLSVYSTIPQALEYEFDCNILDSLVNVLKYCELEKNNDRLLCSSINILTQMLINNYIEPIELEKCFQFLQQKRHSENPVNLLTFYLSKGEAVITSDYLQFILDLMEEYQNNKFVIANLYDILYRSCLKSKDISKILGDKRFIQKLILQTQELVIEQSNEEQAKKNLAWLENLSQSEPVALRIQREKGRELCQLIIKQNSGHTMFAFKILANLAKFCQSIPLSYFLEFLKQNQFPLEILTSLDILFENEEMKQEFLKQNGQQLLHQWQNDYPDQCDKLHQHFKPKQPVIPRQSLLKQRQSLLQQKQLLLQLKQEKEEQEKQEKQQKLEQSQDKENINESQQVIQQIQQPEQNQQLIKDCLELAVKNPQQIIDEGMLERLFQIEDSWEVFRRLTKHQDIAEQVLQPNSKLYQNTLDELKNQDSKFAEQVLETAGQISQVPETLSEFAQTEGPISMVNLIQHQAENPKVVEAGLEALKKLCQDEMILSTIGDSNGIDLQKDLLSKYQNNIEIIKKCDEMIQQLSVSESYQDKIAELGIIQQLIEQITQHPNTLEVVQPAIEALAKIVYRNADNGTVVMESKILDEIQQSQILDDLEEPLLTLINNMCYKNEEIKKQMKIEYLIQILRKNIQYFKQKSFEQCVNTLFHLASYTQNIQKMIEQKLLEIINEFIKKHQKEIDSILLLLNLELKIAAQINVPIDIQTVECTLICLQVEKLEQQALRLIRQILANCYQFIDKLNGFTQIANILKKAELSSCVLTLDVMLKMAAINKESISKFEQLNVGLDFSEILRVNKNDKKLYDQILDYSLKLFNKTNELANQLMIFIQQNEVTELQIDKTLLIVEQVDDNENFIPTLIELIQKNNHKHTKTISIILSRESKVFPNQIFVNKGVDACVAEVLVTKEKEVLMNLATIILDVAKSLEEYRQNIAEQFLNQLEKLNEPVLNELIKFLQGPKKQLSKLTDEIKNFLQKGEILKMYKEDGSRGYYRFFCDETLQQIRCRQESTKLVKQKWILKLNQIQEIKGNYDKKSLSSSAFENQNWLVKQIHKMKHKVIESDRCFTLFAQKNVKPKTLNALCKSESQKQKWVEYIKILIDEQPLLMQQ